MHISHNWAITEHVWISRVIYLVHKDSHDFKY